MTGVELGSGTGAGFTICGSTPGGGLIMPPLASNFGMSSTTSRVSGATRTTSSSVTK